MRNWTVGAATGAGRPHQTASEGLDQAIGWALAGVVIAMVARGGKPA